MHVLQGDSQGPGCTSQWWSAVATVALLQVRTAAMCRACSATRTCPLRRMKISSMDNGGNTLAAEGQSPPPCTVLPPSAESTSPHEALPPPPLSNADKCATDDDIHGGSWTPILPSRGEQSRAAGTPGPATAYIRTRGGGEVDTSGCTHDQRSTLVWLILSAYGLDVLLRSPRRPFPPLPQHHSHMYSDPKAAVTTHAPP